VGPIQAQFWKSTDSELLAQLCSNFTICSLCASPLWEWGGQKEVVSHCRLFRQLTARRPLRHFLNDPRVAIGVLEGNVGAVALALRIRTGDACFRGKRRTVEDVGRLNTAGHDVHLRRHKEGR